MRIVLADGAPSTPKVYEIAEAVGGAIENELQTRLSDADVCQLTYEIAPDTHMLTLEYKGRKHSYSLPSDGSLPIARAFCDPIAAKLLAV